MTSLLRRAFASVRVWLGMNDPAENRLYPTHGWLLPERTLVSAVYATPVMPRAGSKVRFEGGR